MIILNIISQENMINFNKTMINKLKWIISYTFFLMSKLWLTLSVIVACNYFKAYDLFYLFFRCINTFDKYSSI